MESKLTSKQQRVLTFLQNYIDENGFPPTMREIASRLDLAGPDSAKKYLDILERKGCIRKTARSSRAIELIRRDGTPPGEGRAIPLIGRIAAGQPLLAVENIERHINIDPSIARTEGMFFLRVQGDSMIDAHIKPGDLALIRPQQQVDQGDVAVIRVGEEATLKYFFREENRIRLQPANRAYDPIYLYDEDDVEVIGKVAGILREYH
jgi:repressor LexA